MATLAEKIEAERGAREMLRRGNLPQPDWIEYGYSCIRLIWMESKVVLVVDIDEPPDDFDPAGEQLMADLDEEDAVEGFEPFGDLIAPEQLSHSNDDDETEEAA